MTEASWRISLLGTMEAYSDLRTLHHLSMRRIGALLACLVMRAPHPVPREELLDLLWPTESANVARNRLRVLLSSLRQHLEPDGAAPGSVLRAERSAISLSPTAFTSDYHDFLHALREAGTADNAADAIACLEHAIAVYRGELLPGFYDEWILAERSQLADRYCQALRAIVRRLMQNGEPERALEYARQSVAAEPLDEEAHCDLMRIYQAIGQPSAGLRQYHQLKGLLWKEMQAEPSKGASQLAAQIESDVGHGTVKVKRHLRPVTLRASEQAEGSQKKSGTLPSRLNRFFGRTQEIAHLGELLSPSGSTRLVNLLGPGGTGKTRLAIEAAEQLIDAYEGRVYFAALAEIADPNHIGSAIAKALRLPPAPGLDPLSQSIAVLNQAPTLLVLDNLEQLLPDAGFLIEHVLLQAPPLRCLLTSRLSAGVEGEQEITLEPLPAPPVGAGIEEVSCCAGVALFVDRVRSVRSDFALTPANIEDVVELCRALDGLPLAIELAAARTRVMTPAEMRHQTGKLLNWLVDVRGGKTARHKSLRATLEWSYRLLTLEERRFFGALSVFVGGFSAEAAGRVALGEQTELRDTASLLERLRAASLLNIVQTEAATTRFGMLETLREFGLERLSEIGTEAEVRGRHLAYYTEILSQQGEPPLPWNPRAMARVATEDGNLREALEFGLGADATEEQAHLALNLAINMSGYWDVQGRWSEGLAYLRRAARLQAAEERPGAKVALLRSAGALAILLGDYEEARSLSEEGLARAQTNADAPGIAGCLSNLGSVAFNGDNYSGARDRFEQAMQLYKQVEDATNVAACLIGLGNVAFYLGDHGEAQDRFQKALSSYRQSGDQNGVASALLKLGNVRRNQSFFADGGVHFKEAMEIYQAAGHRQGVAACLHDLGLVAINQGDYEEARMLFERAREAFQEIGSRRGVNACLFNLAGVAQGQRDYAGAVSHYKELLETYRRIGDRRNLAACLVSLGDAALHQGRSADARPRYEEALQLEQEIGSRGGIANCLAGLGRLALEEHDALEARTRLAESLRIYFSMGVRAGVLDVLEALAQLAQWNKQSSLAARIAGAASALRKKIGFTRIILPRWNETLAAIGSALGEEAFAAAWRQGESLPMEDAVREALEHVMVEENTISMDTAS
jgi:predicted ATPase/DNA-binding SARP family transcriptional activator/Tfp pilus assembly protein PilF